MLSPYVLFPILPIHKLGLWFQKYSQERKVCKIPVIPPQEAICKAWHQPEAELLRTYDETEWCDNFHNHPVTLAAGAHNKHLVCGYALYMDSTPFTKPDSFYGIFLLDLRFNTHVLVTVIIKNEMCECGCHGWCTIDPIHRWLVHVLSSWAERKMPTERHDGKEWEAKTDDLRCTLAGTDLPCWGAILEIRGDWPELTYSCGLKGHKSDNAPCTDCKCQSDNMFDWDRCSMSELPWEEVTHASWRADADACTVDISIANRLEHRLVGGKLFFDRRRCGSYGGRAMRQPLDLIGGQLLAGDRLETNENLLDTWEYDNLRTFPIVLRFWRTSAEVRLNRRCVLFNIPGATYEKLCMCGLHNLDLGVVSRYVSFTLWFLLVSDIFDLPVSTIDELCNVGLMRLRGELWTYYASTRRADPSSKKSELHDLTPGMLGARDNPIMHRAGGAEIRSLLGFVVAMLENFAPRLPMPQGEYLLRAGRALSHFFAICRSHGRRMSRAIVQSLFDAAISHNKFYKKAGGLEKPKHHAFIHLAIQSLWLGNPRFRTTYRNESLNGTVALVSRSVHRSTFIRSVLQKFGLIQLFAPHLVSGTCMRASGLGM